MAGKRQRVTLELVEGQIAAAQRGQDVVALVTLPSGEEIEVFILLVNEDEEDPDSPEGDDEPDGDRYWSGTGESMDDDSYIDYLNN